MIEEIQYKKYLAHVLYDDALRMSKKELQEVLFFEEETTDSWTLQQCQIQFVKDQISFYESDNLESEVKEIWKLIFKNEVLIMENKIKKEMRIDKLEWRLSELYRLKQQEIFWIEEIKKLKLEIKNG